MSSNIVEHLVHACVVCKDFETSFEFYTEVLDAAAVSPPFDLDLGQSLGDFLDFTGSGTCRVVFLKWGETGSYLELQQYEEPGVPRTRGTKDFGLARIALRVRDLDRALEKVEDHGIPIRGGPSEFTLPNGLRRRGFSISDPDGTLVELIEYGEHREGGK